MSDQNREEQPDSIPTPDPVVDSAFDAIPGASAASADQNPPIVPPAPPTSASDASQPAAPDAPQTSAPAPSSGPSASPVPPPVPPAAPQAYPGAQPAQGAYPAPPAANGYPAGNGYPGAAPGQQPYPGAAYPGAAYPAQPYGATPPAGATRPRFVVSACVLAWVIAALGAIGLIAALSLLARYDVDGGYLAGYLIIPILTIIGLVVFAIFTWQGRGWARIALTVMFALNAVSGLASIGNGQTNALFGLLLSVLGIVLLWLRPSNAWFAAKRASA
ncbi:hypothetical protein [Microbacterium sediminis]|uniref:Uncharacterized protein n=1 Tax=Microbacterium sediminis TaxID=904291 RepID=A0A1B9N9W5_9MICO|nr:hypothetical protein [Microbacterium sediminis]OCG73370.1 hypothetical protein A7J15_08790 [Microbacterium sediminis]QBR75271.1 hypothetical protein E3O41_13260 [Microbacterium sediminis]